MSDLKLKGVKVENEEQINRIMDDDRDIEVRLNEGVVNIIESKEKII